MTSDPQPSAVSGSSVGMPLPRVLLTGVSGQLGQALLASCPASISLIPVSRAELDLADAGACQELVRALRPDWVLNAGAYTAVDRAEAEPELALQAREQLVPLQSDPDHRVVAAALNGLQG